MLIGGILFSKTSLTWVFARSLLVLSIYEIPTSGATPVTSTRPERHERRIAALDYDFGHCVLCFAITRETE